MAKRIRLVIWVAVFSVFLYVLIWGGLSGGTKDLGAYSYFLIYVFLGTAIAEILLLFLKGQNPLKGSRIGNKLVLPITLILLSLAIYVFYG